MSMFYDMLNWAFERHLNPLSWYIRPIFLIFLAFFAYKRSWKGLLITFLVMTSSMVWFPAPGKIDPQMQVVLELEKQLLSSPLTALATLGVAALFVGFVGVAFWKHSLKLGLIALNATLIGKMVLTLLFTGDNGWAPLGNTIFGLVLVNGLGLAILWWMKRRHTTHALEQ